MACLCPPWWIDSRVAAAPGSGSLRKKSVAITIAPFAPLNKAEIRTLAPAAERYGRFLNLPVELDSTSNTQHRTPNVQGLTTKCSVPSNKCQCRTTNDQQRNTGYRY